MGRRVTGVDIDRWSSYRPDAWWKVRIGIALRRSTHWRFMRGASWCNVLRRRLAYAFTHPLVPTMDYMHRGKSALALAWRRSTHWRLCVVIRDTLRRSHTPTWPTSWRVQSLAVKYDVTYYLLGTRRRTSAITSSSDKWWYDASSKVSP